MGRGHLPRFRQFCFFIMLLLSIEILAFGLASNDKNAPVLDIAGVQVWLILDISLGIWTCFAAIFVGITMHYAREHPLWAVSHFLCVLFMVASFIERLEFSRYDLYFFGPLAVVLGLVVSSGLEAIYNSADWGAMRRGLVLAMGNENHSNAGTPLVNMPPNGLGAANNV